MSYIIPLVTKKRIQNKEVMYETVIYADVLFGINLVANLCVLLKQTGYLNFLPEYPE